MNPSYLDWPPPYTIKVSARSRRMTIRISSYNGLEIIIPKKTSQQKAIEFLNLKVDWVQKHRHLLQAKLAIQPSYPHLIYLESINETWAIKYDQKISNKFFSSEATQTLLIQSQACHSTLLLIKKWLRGKAQQHLSLLLQDYSQKYRLPYHNLKVRYQRSRWGSCTKDKTINLNCKLMLLPENLTHYIMVHELVHTIHFDHSPSFWAAVETIIPNQAELRKQLKNIEQQLPNWLYY